MMGNKQLLSLKVRLGVAALAATMLISAAGGGLVAIQSALGADPVTVLVARSIFRTISHKKEEKADRKAINQRRDVEKAEVDRDQQVLDFRRDREWIDQATYDQESARLVALKTAIDERAKRERQITSFQTRRKIRRDWSRAVEDVLIVSTGVNVRAVRITGSLLRGERPITAAINVALSGGGEVVDPRQQFRDLRSTLTEVKEGLRFVRGSAGLIARAQMTRLVRQMGGPDVSSAEQKEALEKARAIAENVEKAMAQARSIRVDLFPRSSGIDRERFADNEKWITFNDNVQTLSVSTAKKVVATAILRAAQKRAEELLEGSGITLTDEQLVAIAKEAAAVYTAARLQDGEVLDAAAVDMDALVRIAVDFTLTAAGQDPLPEGEPGTEGADPEPEPGEDQEPAAQEAFLNLVDVSVALERECRIPHESCNYTVGITMEYGTPRLPSRIVCTSARLGPAAEDLSQLSGTITLTKDRVIIGVNEEHTAFKQPNPADLKCFLNAADSTVAELEGEVLYPLP